MTLLCPRCVQNKGLVSRLVEVRPDYPDEKCDFHPTLKGIPVEDVARIIDEVFRNNYDLGGYDGRINDYVGEDLASILYELTGTDDADVVAALSRQLIGDDFSWSFDGDEGFYRDDATYVRSDEAFNGHSRLWDEFCESIVHGQRFFNDRAKDLLAQIFDGIHLQGGSGSAGAVIEIRPDDLEATVYRVRAEDDPKARKVIEYDISTHLGAPPLRKRRAGRMNPAGVTTLYCAFDLATCIAELRPNVGSFVVAAQFDVIEPIWALDTTRFDAPFNEPNLFSKDHMKRTGQWRFMQRFMQEIAQPISPADEHLDYIPTQAVAEYLLHHHAFHLKGEKRRIEAVIYRSAQRPTGRNIAILGDACLIETATPAQKAKSETFADPLDEILDALPRRITFGHTPKLRLRAGSFEVRQVKGATFDAKPHVGPGTWPGDWDEGDL